MVIDKEKILKLKEELILSINDHSKHDQTFSLKVSSSDIDPKIKEILILMYSISVTQSNENKTITNKTIINIIDVFIEIITSSKDDTDAKLDRVITEVQDKITNTTNTKWYHDYKAILTAGGVFLVIVSFLTLLFSLDSDAATSAIKVFSELFIQLTIPGA